MGFQLIFGLHMVINTYFVFTVLCGFETIAGAENFYRQGLVMGGTTPTTLAPNIEIAGYNE